MIWKSQDMSVVTRDLQYLSHPKMYCGFSNQTGVIFLSPDLSVASKTTSGTMCTPFTPTLIQQQVWRHGKQQLSDRRHGKAFISNYFLGFEPVEWAGISFEAGGRTFHPVVFHSMSGTLISILEGFFINIICFYWSISWVYWLEDNRILQLNSPSVVINSVVAMHPSPVPIFIKNFNSFKENLSELPPLPGKLVLGFQKRWKQRFWVFFFENFLGEHAPRPPCSSLF